MPYRCALALLLALLSVPLVAQEEAGTISMRLRPLSFGQVRGEAKLYLHDLAAPEETPGVEMKLKNYLNHEAMSFMARGRKLVVTAKPDPASARDKDEILGTVAMPEKVRWAVLLFLPAAEGKWNIMPLEDSTRSFPRGSIRVLNLTKYPLRMQVEEKKVDLKPGDNVVIEDPPMGENNHAALRIFAFQEKEWRRVGASKMPHPGTRRVIQLLYENPTSGRVELKGVRDISVADPS